MSGLDWTERGVLSLLRPAPHHPPPSLPPPPPRPHPCLQREGHSVDISGWNKAFNDVLTQEFSQAFCSNPSHRIFHSVLSSDLLLKHNVILICLCGLFNSDLLSEALQWKKNAQAAGSTQPVWVDPEAIAQWLATYSFCTLWRRTKFCPDASSAWDVLRRHFYPEIKSKLKLQQLKLECHVLL